MIEINFESPEQARDWTDENVTQNDPRYTPDIELLNILAYFLYDKAVIVEEKIISNISPPSNEILFEIGKPQALHKYIALELLKSEDIDKENIFFEYTIYGKRADIYATKNGKTILVECCSCYIKKIIDYLKEENTELWIITRGYGPWDKNFPGFEKNKSFWFIIKRGQNWKKYHEAYEKYVEMKIKKVRNPLDSLNIKI